MCQNILFSTSSQPKKNCLKIALQVSKLGFSPLVMLEKLYTKKMVKLSKRKLNLLLCVKFYDCGRKMSLIVTFHTIFSSLTRVVERRINPSLCLCRTRLDSLLYAVGWKTVCLKLRERCPNPLSPRRSSARHCPKSLKRLGR